ncbi:MAG: hypothetical protein ACLTYN_05265 [Dysosmobacter welbionis]
MASASGSVKKLLTSRPSWTRSWTSLLKKLHSYSEDYGYASPAG